VLQNLDDKVTSCISKVDSNTHITRYFLYYAGLSFKIDEIVQAWNEMYDAKKLKNGSSSFRLEPLFRRRPSKLQNILEHIHYT
jgi:hypothetical protein